MKKTLRNLHPRPAGTPLRGSCGGIFDKLRSGVPSFPPGKLRTPGLLLLLLSLLLLLTDYGDYDDSNDHDDYDGYDYYENYDDHNIPK